MEDPGNEVATEKVRLVAISLYYIATFWAMSLVGIYPGRPY